MSFEHGEEIVHPDQSLTDHIAVEGLGVASFGQEDVVVRVEDEVPSALRLPLQHLTHQRRLHRCLVERNVGVCGLDHSPLVANERCGDPQVAGKREREVKHPTGGQSDHYPTFLGGGDGTPHSGAADDHIVVHQRAIQVECQQPDHVCTSSTRSRPARSGCTRTSASGK